MLRHGIRVIVTGRHGKLGHSVQLLVEEDTDTDLEECGIRTSRDVMVLRNVPVVTWDLIMITLAMQFVTMDPILVDYVAVRLDGMEAVATIVCIIFLRLDKLKYCGKSLFKLCLISEITCGNPGSLRHGFVEGSLYTYNSLVIYHCDNFYNLTGGTRTSRCQSNALWSGVKPRCACKRF